MHPPARSALTATPPSADGLLGPADVRALAGRFGIRPTKALGQNFVIDANTVRRIVRIAEVDPGDTVIEVGPGLGSLTLGLLGVARRVVAVEMDPVLAAALGDTVADRRPQLAERLQVLNADALQLTDPGGGADRPTSLVANLPYNVAVPVLLTLLERFPSIRRATVMVQAEVADRLAAPPGSRVYGAPSVKLAWYGRARRVADISRTVFWPVPLFWIALIASWILPPTFWFSVIVPAPAVTSVSVVGVPDLLFVKIPVLLIWMLPPVAPFEASMVPVTRT